MASYEQTEALMQETSFMPKELNDGFVVAINIEPRYPLEAWKSFWKSTGAGDVLWGQDTDATTKGLPAGGLGHRGDR